MQMLSSYAENLTGEAKTRYRDKIAIINGLDPFCLGPQNGSGRLDSAAAAVSKSLPPVDASDLVAYLVLETSFVTAKQFKAHKSLEAYNQFVSGWIKEVNSWIRVGKFIITARVSTELCSH